MAKSSVRLLPLRRRAEPAAPEPPPATGNEDPAVLLAPDVDSCRSFLHEESFRPLVFHRPVFLHGKRPGFALVLRHLQEARSDVAISSTRWPPVAGTVSSRDVYQADRLLVVSVDEVDTDLRRLMRSCEERGGGLWIVGFVSQFTAADLRCFGTFLVFDMAAAEMDALRSTITIPTTAREFLEESTRPHRDEHVLIYVAAQPGGDRPFPPLVPNPIAVPLHSPAP
ncbi:MAG TPA: hypothetical protein VFR67_27315 [Pilimelia sp.]|nr:hypothetical protein [Pilimelia sp.]